MRDQRVDVTEQGPALQPRPSPAGGDRGAESTGQRAARAAEEVGCLPAPCWAGREAKCLSFRGSPGSPDLAWAAGPVGAGAERGGGREGSRPRAHSHPQQEAGGPVSPRALHPLQDQGDMRV